MIERLEKSRRMSQAVIHGDTIYLAGQVGNIGDPVDAQTRTALNEIDRLLKACGTDKTKILSATIWLADIKNFEPMNRVWEQWIDPQHPPARATSEARLADPGYQVEIIVVAAR